MNECPFTKYMHEDDALEAPEDVLYVIPCGFILCLHHRPSQAHSKCWG